MSGWGHLPLSGGTPPGLDTTGSHVLKRVPGGGTGSRSRALAWKTPWKEESGELRLWGRKELDTTEQLSTLSDSGETGRTQSPQLHGRPSPSSWAPHRALVPSLRLSGPRVPGRTWVSHHLHRAEQGLVRSWL